MAQTVNSIPGQTAILIQGGTLIDPSQSIHQKMDLLVSDGKIKAFDHPGRIPLPPGAQKIDAQECWILPGLIDMHVHLREPGLEYKESIQTGTRAAVSGGFSSIVCMANTLPVNDSPYVTAFIRERAKSTATCRVHIVGAITQGLRGEKLAEIGGMVQEGAVAISDDGFPVMNSYLMRKAMDYAKAFDIPIISHAEDLNLVGKGVMNEGALSNELGLRGIPEAAEEIMIAREIALCRLTRTHTHIQHVSSAIGLEHIRRAKNDGLPVTAEVSPHHLTLTEDALRTYDTRFKMSPPLRTERDIEALSQGLKEGVIDVIATDHAPHALTEKAIEFSEAANGVIGLQTAIPTTLKLVHDGVVSIERWVESLTLSPSKILKLNLGTLRRGAPADISVIHPQLFWKFTPELNQSKSQNSPFFNVPLKGKVIATIISGECRFYEPLTG